jgi:hypothetical protein
MSAATKQKNIKIKVIKKSAEKKSEEPKKAFLAAKPAHFKKTFDRSDHYRRGFNHADCGDYLVFFARQQSFAVKI